MSRRRGAQEPSDAAKMPVNRHDLSTPWAITEWTKQCAELEVLMKWAVDRQGGEINLSIDSFDVHQGAEDNMRDVQCFDEIETS